LKERTLEEYIRLIQSVLEDIITLGNTANRLLLLTMTDTDSYQVSMGLVRVDELLWEAQAELQKTHPGYKIVIRFEGKFDAEQYLSIKGNDQLLRIAFLNLIENGCKYSENQRVEVILEHRDSLIQFSFRDKGVGIPKEEQELVFEPFYRAKNVSHMQGSGLGLSLVRRITRLHGGSISLVSEQGKGSDFTLQFQTIKE
ncbi:MAG: HAMP domain-containing sensor histidine kinase, partial [Bacteroidota bacterium]